MPSKKRRSPAECSSVTQNSKRRNISPLSNTSKCQRNEDDGNSTDGRIMDSYCWICHKPGIDIIGCKYCVRAYHALCLNKNSVSFKDDKCPECRQKILDLQNQRAFITDRTLREMLTVAAEAFRKKTKGSYEEYFFRWCNVGNNKLVKIMDFDIIEDNIMDYFNPYKTFAEVISDIKWIHHNFNIVEGVNSDVAKDADAFVKKFLEEISTIKDCPMCYHRMFVGVQEDDFFEKICQPPHDIIWASLKGSSAWPAKCLNIKNGKAHVLFFGTHDKATISLKKQCLAISLYHPKYKQSKLTDKVLTPRNKQYKAAVTELLQYVNNFEESYRCKFKFYETGTPYLYTSGKPGEEHSTNFNGCSTLENSEENTAFESLSDSEETDNLSHRSQHIEVGGVAEDDTSNDSCILLSSENDASREEQNGSQEELNKTDNLSHRSQHNKVGELEEDDTSNDSCILLSPENDASREEQNDADVAALSTRNTECSDQDDVIFVGSFKSPPKDNKLPMALEFLLHCDPNLARSCEQVHQLVDSSIIHKWAAASGNPEAPEVIRMLLEKLREINLDNQRLQENKKLRQFSAQQNEERNSFKMRMTASKKKCRKLEADLISVTRNADDVVKGTINTYSNEFKKRTEALRKTCNQTLVEQKALLQQKTKEVEEAFREIEETKNNLELERQTVEELTFNTQLLEIKCAATNAKNEVYLSLSQRGLIGKEDKEALHGTLQEEACRKSIQTETSEAQSSKESIANFQKNLRATKPSISKNFENNSSSNSEADDLRQTSHEGSVSPLSSKGWTNISMVSMDQVERATKPSISKNFEDNSSSNSDADDFRQTSHEASVSPLSSKGWTKISIVSMDQVELATKPSISKNFENNSSSNSEADDIRQTSREGSVSPLSSKGCTKISMVSMDQVELPNSPSTSEMSYDSVSSTSEATSEGDYLKQTSHESSSPLSDEQLSPQLLTDQVQANTLGIPWPAHNLTHPFLNPNPSTLGCYSTHHVQGPQINEIFEDGGHQGGEVLEEVEGMDHQGEVETGHQVEEHHFQGALQNYNDYIFEQQCIEAQDEENYILSHHISHEESYFLIVDPSTLNPTPFFGYQAGGAQTFEMFDDDDL